MDENYRIDSTGVRYHLLKNEAIKSKSIISILNILSELSVVNLFKDQAIKLIKYKPVALKKILIDSCSAL